MNQKKELKMYPDFFATIQGERKSLETRKNDSDYQVGDLLTIKEYDPSIGYTGKSQDRIITYTSNAGQKNGYIMFEMEVI